MRMREFESKLLKLVSVTSISYNRRLKGKVFETDVIYVHTGPGQCHMKFSPNCMEKQLAYFQKLCKKES